MYKKYCPNCGMKTTWINWGCITSGKKSQKRTWIKMGINNSHLSFFDLPDEILKDVRDISLEFDICGKCETAIT